MAKKEVELSVNKNSPKVYEFYCSKLIEPKQCKNKSVFLFELGNYDYIEDIKRNVDNIFVIDSGFDYNLVIKNNINNLEEQIKSYLEKNKMVKFDVTIMNPPYDGNLHLEILEIFTKYSDNVINLSPVRWLQDLVADKKKKSDIKKFKSIINKISNIEIVKSNQSNEIFNISAGDIGIYTLDNTEQVQKFNYKEFQKISIGANKYNLILKILNKEKTSIGSKKQKGFDQTKYAVPLATVRGFGSGKNYDIVSTIHSEPYHNYSDFLKRTFKKKDVNEKDPAKQQFLEFNSYNEAKNFIASTKTEFFYFINVLLKIDQNVPLNFLPYMNDYTKSWTNKHFCEYFEITGYISDTEAEPDSEWEIILNTLKDYK